MLNRKDKILKFLEGEEHPTFKTRSVWYDSFGIRFGPHAESLKTGKLEQLPEFGTSTSLDGCYLDLGLHQGFTMILPIDLPIDLPKFYLNPYGQYKVYVGHKEIILDSSSFIHEVEVKYPKTINTSNILAMIIHVNKENLERDFEKKKKLWEQEKYENWQEGWKESLIEHDRMYFLIAKEIIDYIEGHFIVLDDIPITPFRETARKIVAEVQKVKEKERIKDFDEYLKIPIAERAMKEFRQIEEISRELHKLIAYTYRINYDKVVLKTEEHLKDIEERRKI